MADSTKFKLFTNKPKVLLNFGKKETQVREELVSFAEHLYASNT